jgi:hypothetical protein
MQDVASKKTADISVAKVINFFASFETLCEFWIEFSFGRKEKWNCEKRMSK